MSEIIEKSEKPVPPESLRTKLMYFGVNGGRKLTDDELAEFLITEINQLPTENRLHIANAIASELPMGGTTYL